MRALVDELKFYDDNAFEYEGKHINITLHALICDVPAKAFVSGTKSHTGFKLPKMYHRWQIPYEESLFPKNL